MLKYCFILDNETGLVQLGTGCSDEYYQEIGMQQRDVDQSDIDYNWYLSDKCPHKSEEQKFIEAKTAKYQENDIKAEQARTGKIFTLTLQEKECEFDTKYKTQTDLLTAAQYCSAGFTYDGWVCNNGTVINLMLEDVLTISTKFKQITNVYPQWNSYKIQIDAATTIEEVNAIIIDYNEPTDYTVFTVAQLKQIANERGISYPSNILKADLIALLEG